MAVKRAFLTASLDELSYEVLEILCFLIVLLHQHQHEDLRWNDVTVICLPSIHQNRTKRVSLQEKGWLHITKDTMNTGFTN